ncbi:MAG: pseudouridine synthase [Terracidiphilus sp.]
MTTPKKSIAAESKPQKTTKAKKSSVPESVTSKAIPAETIESELPEAILEIASETPTPKTRAAKKLKSPSASNLSVSDHTVADKLISVQAASDQPASEQSASEQSALNQGTTLVVPEKRHKKSGALASAETSAQDSQLISSLPDAESEDSTAREVKPRPPAKLERLQKILAAAGVASRRSAETMIEQGRVQVNGKVVTELGTKADAGRDHIRVDGKLLQGAERLRYFILNKPRGFVTTVKDPEGRPTVMQFFDKMKERLYPVGRLDYLSEGLLVVTNDGELANKLTKASSGVEKTYLVKVAGQPTEAELDILRGGVTIALGKPGSRTVRTSPARVRQVRQGDNPWYEVVLIEGRNRELRKMFEEIGHFVEKIRRTGYGPLVLDQEPGNLRELQPEELEALRKAADGKLRTPKSKDLRRRNLLDAGLLPTVLPKPSSRPRIALPAAPLPAGAATPVRTDWSRPGAFKPKKFGQSPSSRPAQPTDRFASGDANKFFRPARPSNDSFRPSAGRTSAPNPVRSFSQNEEERPPRTDSRAPENFGFNRPSGRSFDRPDARPGARSDSRSASRPVRNFERPASRPAWKRDDRPTRPPARSAEGPTGEARPFTPKPAWKKPEGPGRSARPSSFSKSANSPRPDRPTRPERLDRPARPDFKRSAPPRRDLPARETRVFDEDSEPIRPPNLHIEEITGPSPSSFDRPSGPRSSAPRSNYSRPSASRPYADRSPSSRPSAPRSYSDRPTSDRPRPSRPGQDRPNFDWPAPSGRPSNFRPRPSRPTGDRPTSSRPSFTRPEGGRPSFTSSGQPRPGGARPSSKPGKFGKPGASTRSKPRPGVPADRSSSVGWKPGNSAKPSHRVKPGGKSSGKKRNY